MRGKPAPKKGAKGGRAPSSAPAPAPGYQPGKIGRADMGLQPAIAVAAAAAVLVGGVGLTLATGGRAHALTSSVQAGVAGGLARAGFRVGSVVVEGASRFSVPYIVKAADLQDGAPLMGLDLADVRHRVESVGWVKSVRVLRLMPDTVVIAVSERPRLAVWQDRGQSHVIDPGGQVIPEADPGLFVDLPLVVGDGAPEAAGALLPELAARPRLTARLEAAVRVDGRRWDLRLKDGSLIELPDEDQDSALIQLDQLDQKDRLLDLGFERIDLRDPEMVVVRPRAPAASAVQPAVTKPSAPAAKPAAPPPAAAAIKT
jgi:cell division protein FtsQ